MLLSSIDETNASADPSVPNDRSSGPRFCASPGLSPGSGGPTGLRVATFQSRTSLPARARISPPGPNATPKAHRVPWRSAAGRPGGGGGVHRHATPSEPVVASILPFGLKATSVSAPRVIALIAERSALERRIPQDGFALACGSDIRPVGLNTTESAAPLLSAGRTGPTRWPVASSQNVIVPLALAVATTGWVGLNATALAPTGCIGTGSRAPGASGPTRTGDSAPQWRGSFHQG